MASYEKQLELVKEHLKSNESIKFSVFGTYECKVLGQNSVRNGIMIATEKSVIFYAKKLGGYDLETFPLENISSIEVNKGMIGHKISFFSSGNKVEMKWINKGNPNEFLSYVRDNMGKSNSMVSQLNEDIPAQIKKLADLKEQGILTEEEFAKKKSDLLSKM